MKLDQDFLMELDEIEGPVTPACAQFWRERHETLVVEAKLQDLYAGFEKKYGRLSIPSLKELLLYHSVGADVAREFIAARTEETTRE